MDPRACPSPSMLEAAAADEPVSPEIETHIRHCKSCSEQLSEIRENQAFLRRAGPALAGVLETPPPRAEEVPGFELLEEVSRGGQGVVFRAVQIDTKRPAAVKMLLAGALASTRQQLRFDREIEIAARLRHPNIISIFDAGQTPNGSRFVAMEFIEGIPVDEYVRRSLPTPAVRTREQVDAAVRLLAAVAGAVGHAHTNGVIHRDLKPSNVLVDSLGNPRVLDFGLARPAGSHSDATMTQEFVGTPAYAAPEQFGSSVAADARSDVYSLGVMLYRALTATHPYPCDGTFAEIARHAIAAAPAQIRKLAPRVSRDLETIVLKCIAKEPDRRYPSGSALEADLIRYLRDEAIDARRDSAWYMLRKAAAQNRRMLAAIGIVAVILLANAFLLTRQMFAARTAALRTEFEQQRADAEAVRSEANAYLIQNIIPHDLFPEGKPNPLGRMAYDSLIRVENQLEMGMFAHRPELELALHAALGTIYADSPHLAGAGEISVRHALTSRLREFGPDHPETAVGYRQLAEVLLVRKRFEEAEIACRTAIDIQTRHLPADDAAVGLSCELLARIRVAAGNPQTAREPAQRAADVLVFRGRLARERAMALRTLASVEATLGIDESAAEHAAAALTVSLENLADDDHVLADCIAVAATIDATALIRRLPQSDGQAPANLTREWLSGLAAGLRGGGVNRARSDCLSDLLQLRRRVLRPGHPAIARGLTSLARQLATEGKYEAAVARFVDALPLLEAEFGPGHMVVANCCEQIGQNCVWLRRYRDAVRFTERSRNIWAAQPPAERDEITIAAATRWEGWFRCFLGDWSRGAELSRDAIDRFTRILGPDHYAVAMARSQLAWQLAELGQLSEATSMARRAFETAFRSPATPPDQDAWIESVLGLVLVRAGNYAEGARHLELGTECFWEERATYPVDPFVRALRDAYVAMQAEEELQALDTRWQDVFSRTSSVDSPSPRDSQ